MVTGFLARADLGTLVDALHDDGRAVIAPTVQDGAIVYDEIATAADLPIGWRDEQAPGRYRIEQGGDERAFGYTVGPTSWKRYTFPSRVPSDHSAWRYPWSVVTANAPPGASTMFTGRLPTSCADRAESGSIDFPVTRRSPVLMSAADSSARPASRAARGRTSRAQLARSVAARTTVARTTGNREKPMRSTTSASLEKMEGGS